jgi:hypothetical protein
MKSMKNDHRLYVAVGIATFVVVSLAAASIAGTSSLAASHFAAQAQETCTDSDGGLNYTMKGGASRGNTPPYTDSCYCPINRKLSDLGACADGPFVGEWFCNASSYTEMKTYECPNGCRDGACVAQISSSCGDDVVDASKGEECDDGQENGKNGWCNAQCKHAPCTDTDGGRNEFQKGVTRSGFGETTGAEDICASDGVSVYEAYCDGNTIKSSVRITCANGCENGACKKATGNVCTDTDGKDPTRKGSMTSTELEWKDAEEYCATPNHDATNSYSYASSCSGNDCFVFEYSCSGTQPNTDAIRCPQGCGNGACKPDDKVLPSIIDIRTNDNYGEATFYLSALPPIAVQLNVTAYKGTKVGPDGQGVGGGGMRPQQAKQIIFGGLREDFERAGGDGTYTIEAEVCPGPLTPGGFDYPDSPPCGPTFTKTIQYKSSFQPPVSSSPSAGYEDEVRVIDQRQSSKNWFRDMSGNTPETVAANFLAQNGIIGGFPDNTFRAGKLVNRAEAAKFLMLARFKNVEDRTNSGKFWDIPDGEWYVRFVMKAAELGVINGHPDGSFKPQDPVKTGEFLKMLALTFDLPQNLPYEYSDVHTDDWFAPYVGIAAKYKFLSTRSACDANGCNHNALLPEMELTRGEVAIAIYKILGVTTDYDDSHQ